MQEPETEYLLETAQRLVDEAADAVGYVIEALEVAGLEHAKKKH